MEGGWRNFASTTTNPVHNIKMVIRPSVVKPDVRKYVQHLKYSSDNQAA